MTWEEGEKGRENLMKKFGMSQGGPEVLQHTALQCTEDRSPPMTTHISSTLTVDTSSTLQSVLREECGCDLHWAMSTSHLSDRSCNTTDRLGCLQLHVRPLWKPGTECSAPGLLLLVRGRENDRTGPSQGSSNAERSFRSVPVLHYQHSKEMLLGVQICAHCLLPLHWALLRRTWLFSVMFGYL